jgi:hypothetical protein
MGGYQRGNLDTHRGGVLDGKKERGGDKWMKE